MSKDEDSASDSVILGKNTHYTINHSRCRIKGISPH